MLKKEHLPVMIEHLTTLNKTGEELGNIKGVTAMTDVTGFGLPGHLIEMAEGSGLGAEIYYDKMQLLPGVKEYIAQRIIPDATTRNWNSYCDKVKFEKARPDDPVRRGINVMEVFPLLPYPQTNSGLLVSVKEESVEEVKKTFHQNSLSHFITAKGKMIVANEKRVWAK